MFELSVGSLYFFLFPLLGPIVLRNKLKIRPVLFLAMNLLVYVGGAKSALQLIVAGLFLLVPYFCVKYTGIRKPLLVGMVAAFVYLMQYDLLLAIVPQRVFFLFKILGISYFLFREIDFVMQYDVLKEEGVKITLLDYCNFVLSFYTLLAGPITRYQAFAEDFYKEQTPLTKDEVIKGLNRCVNGYLKVYVASGICGYLAKYWFDGLANHSNFITTAVAFVLFAYFNCWFIYFNFSGYCDVMVSAASLAGISIPENFNRPYLARSVVEFWNRHHISLSEWIRDYIFSPMFKGLISGPCQNNVMLGQCIALFLTFTIAGIWHGTDLNYLVYGLFQGLGIVVATVWKAKRKKLLGKERNKKYEKSLAAITLGRCITWMYISLTFSFVGYDVIGFLFR